jgi:uncharacterized OsmC-like protein
MNSQNTLHLCKGVHCGMVHSTLQTAKQAALCLTDDKTEEGEGQHCPSPQHMQTAAAPSCSCAAVVMPALC